MKLIRIAFFFVLPALSLLATPLSTPIASDAAIVINADSGTILYQKNAAIACYPASVTKVATALYVLQFHSDKMQKSYSAKKEAIAAITAQAKKNSNYRQPAYWLQPDASHIGIKAGEEFVLKDLMAAMLIASANDAANVIAESLEGNISQFMEKLNLYLKKIGCQHSYFLNPHGLHHPEHKTAAIDLAIMAKEAMRYPYFRELVKSKTYTLPPTNLTVERHLLQTNLLLRSGPFNYKKAIGIKTGSTSQAGKTLIAAAKDKERTLIAVILGSQTNDDRYNDAMKLFEQVFQEPKLRYNILKAGLQKFTKKVPHGKGLLQTYLADPLFYEEFASEKRPVRVKVEWLPPLLPIEKASVVGKVVVQDDRGRSLTESPLLAAVEIQPTLFFKFTTAFVARKQFIVLFLCLSFVIFLLFLFLRARRQKRGQFTGRSPF